MKYFLKSTAFKILSGTILIITGIALYTHSNGSDNFFEDFLSSAEAAVQKPLSHINACASDFFYRFEEKDNLKAENEELKSEISTLRDKVADYYDVKRENARFAKYYDFKEANKTLKFVSASVIGKPTGEVFADFVIDKGRSSGISLNDAVITENGMVGRICRVSENSSRVKTILSPNCKVGAIDSKTGDSGIISGSLDLAAKNLTRITFIPAQSSIAAQDIVTTCGFSGMYPKNLKIGKIKSVEYDSYESSYYALIEPFEKIKEVRDVFVVTDFQGKGELKINSDEKN